MTINLNSHGSIKLHRKIIREKKILSKIYKDFYMIFKDSEFPKGRLVEIGSGSGFIKEIIPGVITSDVTKKERVDLVFSATKIPFGNNSVSAFFMLDVLHHIKNPEKALREMLRCLKKQGKIIMIEPYNSLWGRVIYRYFHHEGFDPNAGWKVKRQRRKSNTNTAIPWIIFMRDRRIFEKKFPNLKIIRVTPHTPFIYLLSGGLSKPQLLPAFLYPIVRFIEQLTSPLKNWIGLFVTIELEKTN